MQTDDADLGQKAGAIVIKGKYLAAIREYAATLSFDDELLVKNNPEFQALQSAVLNLHGKFLNRDSAFAVLFRECYSFALEHKDRIGPLSMPENQDIQEGMVQRLKACIES